MALTRVRNWAVARSSGVTGTVGLSPLPAVGNGLVVVVNCYRGDLAAVPAACTDNQGNGYVLATYQAYPGWQSVAALYYCAKVAASSGTFTVSLTLDIASGGNFWVCQAVEVGGVGAGLAVDQVAGTTGPVGTTVTTGVAPALTAAEVFQVASFAIEAAQSAITVAVASPVWTEEFEELPYTHIAGEAVSRVVTGALGTTPSCTWTITTPQHPALALAAFKVASGGGGSAAGRDLNTLIDTYLPSADVTTATSKKLATMGPNQTAAMKTIIRDAGGSN